MIINEHYLTDVDDEDDDIIQNNFDYSKEVEAIMRVKILNADPKNQEMPKAEKCDELYKNFCKCIANILIYDDLIESDEDITESELYQIGYSMDDTRHDVVNKDAEPYMFFLYLCGFCFGRDVKFKTTLIAVSSIDSSDLDMMKRNIKTFLRRFTKNKYLVDVDIEY